MSLPIETTDSGSARVLPHQILLAVDGSPQSDPLIAITAALGCPFPSEVTVLRVINGKTVHGRVDVLDFELERAEALQHLNGVAAKLRELGVNAEPLLVEGRAAEQIVRVAQERSADLLVLSSHGEGGVTDWSLGGTAQRLIQSRCTSLLVLPAHFEPQDGFERIFVPLDGSKRSEFVLPLVEALAKHHDAEVVLFHAVVAPELPHRAMPSREDRDLVDRLIERNRTEAENWLGHVAGRLRAHDIRVRVRVDIRGGAYRATAAAAKMERADLVVLCAHGATADPRDCHGGLPSRLLASVTVPTLVVQDLPVLDDAPRTPTGAEWRATPTGSSRFVLHLAL